MASDGHARAAGTAGSAISADLMQTKDDFSNRAAYHQFIIEAQHQAVTNAEAKVGYWTQRLRLSDGQDQEAVTKRAAWQDAYRTRLSLLYRMAGS